ncbi:hypothetical protein [Aestuariicoccus sp. MJ-SS9]|uniref:hypothetical protein n=1 Tax=Aestuariicoccus sp. MJ-SS9 TaxID=3079855 RepID=UPI00291249DB|nr:hypothetical protein [Aestuariicoccus sp. MJ-SS9]MDU8914136.1 hypothetical protein [Aestuariicoccus sp. MJ-SS9]
MPNPIAYLVLALWPVVTAVLLTRLPLDRAIILSLLLGYLFLPEPPAVFDLPAMPPFNKHNIPALSVFLICLWRFGLKGSILPESRIGRALLLTFVLSPVLTVLTNAEPVFYGQIGLPGLGPKDMVALVVQQFLLVLPYLLARRFLAEGGAQRELLVALAVSGLVYSLLMLIEIRLSPQLNLWIFGYYQHYFGQSVRFGGYRPVVFLYHGLWVAFFTLTAVTAAWALWRNDARQNGAKYLVAAIYLTVILVLAKSLGAMIFAVLLIPAVVFLSRLMQIRLAIVIGLLAISYPILKGADLVPQDRLLQQAAQIDPDRANSLEFRFENENILMERAYEKPVFGWGSWGRNHILDPTSGNILTVTDGRWIIVIGVYGWVGFLAEFGLLVLPLILLWRETRYAREEDVSPFIAPLSLLLAINVFDLLPNATLTPLTWLLAGALTGYAERSRARNRQSRQSHTALRWRSIM